MMLTRQPGKRRTALEGLRLAPVSSLLNLTKTHALPVLLHSGLSHHDCLPATLKLAADRRGEF